MLNTYLDVRLVQGALADQPLLVRSLGLGGGLQGLVHPLTQLVACGRRGAAQQMDSRSAVAKDGVIKWARETGIQSLVDQLHQPVACGRG